MRLLSWIKNAFVCLACSGLVIPDACICAEMQTDRSASANSSASKIQDVAIQSGGLMRGHVSDKVGKPVAGRELILVRRGRRVASTRTDAEGRFVFAVEQGGLLQVASAGGVASIRAWQLNTAPPNSSEAASLIEGDPTVRGQSGGPIAALFCNPYLLAATVALLVAVPIILHNRRDDRGAAS